MAKGPWVSSFENDACQGPGAGDAVGIPDHTCVPFHPKYDSIAVNFGGGHQVPAISVYSDGNCQNPAGRNIVADEESGFPQQCVSMKYHGSTWGSVAVTQPLKTAGDR